MPYRISPCDVLGSCKIRSRPDKDSLYSYCPQGNVFTPVCPFRGGTPAFGPRSFLGGKGTDGQHLLGTPWPARVPPFWYWGIHCLRLRYPRGKDLGAETRERTWVLPPPPSDRQTDACENSTFFGCRGKM